MAFEDHFSGHADAYAQYRPRYPDELFSWLASLIPGRVLAWDAGTGSGQVAVALTEHVDRVVATDASADQLAQSANFGHSAFLSIAVIGRCRGCRQFFSSGRKTLPGADAV